MISESVDDVSGPRGGEQPLREIAAEIESGTSVVVAGPLGTGKTLLTRRLHDRLSERGREPLLLHPAEPLVDVPFGVLDAAEDERALLLRRGETPPGTIVLVDDAQDLDPASASALARAVYVRKAAVLFALAVPRVVSADASGGATSTIVDLWLRGFAQRVDLSSLSARGAEALVARSSEGVLDQVTQDAIVWQANGSRALLQELTATAIAAARAGADPLSAVRNAPPHGRLAAAMDAHVRDLDDETLRTLVLIDRAPGLGYADAARSRPAAEIDALLSAGYLAEDRSPGRHLHANRSLARAAARRLGQRDASAAVTDATRPMLAAEGSWFSAPLAAAAAAHWLRDATSLEGLDAGLRDRVLLATARTLNDRGTHDLAAAHAESLVSPSPELQIELFYARSVLGEHDCPPAPTGPLTEEGRVRALRLSARLRARRRARCADILLEAGRTVETEADRMRGAGEKWLLDADAASQEMRWEDSIAAGERAIAEDAADVRPRALMTIALAAAIRGYVDTARRETTRFRTLIDEEHQTPPSCADRLRMLGVALVVVQIVGDDPGPLIADIRGLRRRAVREGDGPLLALAGLVGALAATLAGDGAAGARELRMAQRRLAAGPQDSVIALLMLCCAYPLALKGESTLAAEIVSRVAGVWGDGAQMLEQMRACTESAIHLADGDVDDAREAARRALALSADIGAPPVRARDLFRALALGVGGGMARTELAALAADAGIPIVDRLRAAAETLPTVPDATSALIAFSQTIVWAAPPIADPAVAAEQTAPAAAGIDALTRREREIALLADAGLSNRDIAQRLFLSVRTVESHIYQARGKINARTRRDLGTTVAGWCAGSPEDDSGASRRE